MTTEYNGKDIYTIRISAFVHELVRRLHKEYPHKEWSGICRTEKEGEGKYVITDMIFAEQKNGSGSTIITKKGREDIMQQVFEKTVDNPEAFQEYNCWLHSHNSMSCFWSGTDTQQMADHNELGGLTHFISIVTAYKNLKGVIQPDYLGRINFYEPLDFAIEPKIEVERIDEVIKLEKEMEENIVKEIEKMRLSVDDEVNRTTDIIMNAMPSSSRDAIKSAVEQEMNANIDKKAKEIENKYKFELAGEQLEAMREDIEKKVKELKDVIVSTPTYANYFGLGGFKSNNYYNSKREKDTKATVEEYVNKKMGLHIEKDGEGKFYTDNGTRIYIS